MEIHFVVQTNDCVQIVWCNKRANEIGEQKRMRRLYPYAENVGLALNNDKMSSCEKSKGRQRYATYKNDSDTPTKSKRENKKRIGKSDWIN